VCLVIAGSLAARSAEAPGYSVEAISHATKSGDDEALDNTSFEFTGCGLSAAADRLLLRLRLTSKSNTQEIGTEGQVRLDAFPATTGTSAAPIYSIAAEGSDGRFLTEPCLFALNRGLEEFDWWEVYSLRNGKRLFQSSSEPFVFSFMIEDDIRQTDTAGLYVPPDDETDATLKQPDIAGVVALTQDDKLQSLAVIRIQNKVRAQELRSYADERRYLSIIDARTGASLGQASGEKQLSQRPLALEIYWAAANLRLKVPVTKTGLDLAHATLPLGFRLEPMSGGKP
jgi:hypothetical protein